MGSHNEAIVGRLRSVRAIENSQNIQSAVVEVKGIPIAPVVVGLDSKDGDWVVYFDSNLVLSDSLLTDYADLATYLSKGNRVRVVKLRGQISNGLAVPLEKFSKYAYTGKVWDDGESFLHIEKVEICRKYVPPAKPVAKTAKKVKKEKEGTCIVPGAFPLHVDTDQLARNIDRVHPDDVIQISRKTHGCLLYNTPIIMADGTTKRIKDVVAGDIVWGVDHITNDIVPTEVTRTFINGQTDEWYNVKISDNHKSTVKCTGNHKFFVKHRGYIEASRLSVGDKIIFGRKALHINDQVKQVLIAKAMADGWVGSNSNTLMLQFSHEESKVEYLRYCNKLLGNLNLDLEKVYKSGYGSTIIRSHSKQTYAVNYALREYMSGKKFNITAAIIKDMTPLMLAIWYMDDGSLTHTEVQRDRAQFAICAYGDEVIPHLTGALSKFGITNITFHKTNNGGKEHLRLRINADSTMILFNLIKEYVPECMQYKLPPEYRGFFREPVTIIDGFTYLEDERDVVSVDRLTMRVGRKYHTKYDIETGTHNFFANNILVHNSSGRCALVPIYRKLTTLEKIAKFLGINVSLVEYKYAYGSRTVTKEIDGVAGEAHKHYYGSDIWSEAGHNYFYGRLHEGESVYYEIIGYMPAGAPIQKSGKFIYDYGNDPGKYSIQVYRITMTTLGGVVTELSVPAYRARCKELGVAPVTEYYYGRAADLFPTIPENEDWGKLFLADLTTKYLEKDAEDCLKKGTPDEGIVLRIEGLNINCLKHKSQRFFLAESASHEEGDDIEEEA